MRHKGRLELTQDLIDKVEDALRNAADQCGMTIIEFSVVASSIIKVWHKDSGMKIEVEEELVD